MAAAMALRFGSGVAQVAWEVLFQKLALWGVPPLEEVGGPAEGLTCIVTGPTSGIGRETALALAKRGAHVVLACRSLVRGEHVKDGITQLARAHGVSSPQIEVKALDLASLASVRAFAADWKARGAPLHVLINNAGIFSMGAERVMTDDGFEAHLGTNYLGPFLLSLLLLPIMLRTAEEVAPGKPVRIVNVASKMHELAVGLDPGDPHLARPGAFASVTAYSQSKLAQIMWTIELRRRLGPSCRVHAVVVHPGEVLTDVVRTLPATMQRAYHMFMRLLCLSPAQGARSSVYCATSRDKVLYSTVPEACYYGPGCKPVTLRAPATDKEQSCWLWQWSADIVGLPQGCDLPAALVPLDGKRA